MPLSIESIDRSKEPARFEKLFAKFPWKVYRDAGWKTVGWKKAWCPPLLMDVMDQWDPKKNVELGRLEVEAFLAVRDGAVVGRIAAIKNNAHLAHFQDGTGFFGWFECLPDREAALALLNHAGAWLKARGVEKIRGPFSFSINGEWGWKCDCGPGTQAGFDIMPMVKMPHNPPYYNEFATAWNMAKVQDHYAYHMTVDSGLSPKMRRVAEYIEKKAEKSEGGLTYRQGNLKDWDHEVSLVKEIHDDAWDPLWGTIKYTSEELDHVAKDLKLIIEARLLWFVFVKGEVAGFIMALPDVNEFQYGMDGKVLSPGLLNLLWGLKVRKKFKRARCVLLGMKRKFQGKGLEAPLIVRLFEAGRGAGIYDIELSWILESNLKMRREIEPFTKEIWMSYRAYEKTI